ncbi:MAG: sulfoxide reductase heme-binding subunit YedZ [Magnetococcales bacterium]|nr:sulfoxide reductase heme-binding subunit YedZ [Magnetococcales bacterium]
MYSGMNAVWEKKMRILKAVLFGLGLLPLIWLIYGALTAALGANPIEYVNRTTGDWALWLLLLTLTITPLRRLSGWAWVMQLRRMLGLFCFFYASLHVTSYVALDQFFAWHDILRDVRKRPYITIGLITFSLLLPLAITSTRGWMKRLGRHWQSLHRLVYPAAMLAVLHFFLMVKADWRSPTIHGMALVVLLGWRVFARHGKLTHPIRRKSNPSPGSR